MRNGGKSSAGVSDGTDSRGVKRKAEDSDSEPEPEDNVRLWEEGWKQRYYKTKFDVDVSDEGFRKKVVQSYVEGLCWVLRYYYQVTLRAHVSHSGAECLLTSGTFNLF
ncbi:5'-3' exoribonuclease 2 [Xenoophorus captivus]|uniref:5'-3' exoribonuclease 2 n=1 Tax=Xenoophorus captivus TaxID=1517983 RepID=A0ABV0SAH9_9TELE